MHTLKYEGNSTGDYKEFCFICNCFMQCVPPFVGDGVRCTLDSDGDLYPNVALDTPRCTNSDSGEQLETFCIQVY